MREGWTYKKLGEVGIVVTGSTPSTKDEANYASPDYSFIKPSDLPSKGIAVIDESEFHISSKAFSSARQLPKGSVVVSCIGIIGKVGILNKDACTNQQINAIIPNDTILPKCLAYIICYNKRELEQIANAPIVPIINKSEFSKFSIPVPPLSEQQSIVVELDKINELISLKKAQLSDLDSLAQSIFYDMFGDPITNDKGWKEGKMGEYCTITSSKRIFANEYCEEGVPFYRGKEITELSKDLPISIELYISQSRYEEIKRDYGIPAIGDILITAVGTIGNIWVVNNNSPFYFKDGNIVWVKDIKGFDPGFFKTILTIQISAYKHEMAQGCAYNALTIVNLKKMKVLLPPLSLQQEFAKRIELIEQQKAQISSTIKDLETLLASRMQYWFD